MRGHHDGVAITIADGQIVGLDEGRTWAAHRVEAVVGGYQGAIRQCEHIERRGPGRGVLVVGEVLQRARVCVTCLLHYGYLGGANLYVRWKQKMSISGPNHSYLRHT